MENDKRQMERNYYIVAYSHIYPDADSSCISNCFLHSVCDTSMGSDIQIIYKA
jgi:hypothetical protein